MKIRKYTPNDLQVVCELFYDTIHAVNAKDYTAEQLAAWANSPDCLQARRDDLLRQYTLVAELDGKIAGFGSIDISGELDLLYVHKDCQRQGIATALCDALENGFSTVTTYASITAKPFFIRRGYVVVQEQEVERFGVKLKNFAMRKDVR